MAQDVIERKLGELAFKSGGTSTLELPRSHYYERLQLLAHWDVTVNTAGATTFNELGILDLIQSIRVQINGNQTLKNVSFGMNHYVDNYQYGTRPVYEEPDLGTASNQTGDMESFVDFTIAPGDYAAMLPAFQTSDAVLTINWGTAANVVNDETELDVNDVTVEVRSRERIRDTVAKSGSSKETRVLNSLMAFKEREKKEQITAQGQTPVDLPRGNVYYAVPFLVTDDATPSNDLVSEFEIAEDGVTTHRDLTTSLARAGDKSDYGIENLRDGFVYPAFGVGADLNDTIPTAGVDKFELKLDTENQSPTAPAATRLVTQELIR
jgi:hypothetical protein